MVKKLEIRIGAHRDDAVLAHVNDSSRPTIIDTPLFVGRILVKIRDFDGVTADGGPPTRDHVYFDKRNRRFDMQIEGRFKARPGVAPYRGDEVEFGTDFDHLVSFPMTPFKLGMRVAKSIDPNTHYDSSPPSGRPFIMSPYAACMNTLSAWPSPARYGDALVALHDPQGAASGSRDRSDSLQDIVPVEASRTPRKVWHFLGLKGDPKVDALIAKNRHLMPEPVTAASPAPARRPLPRHQSSFGLRVDRDDTVELANRQKHAELVKKADKPEKPAGRFSSLTSKFSNLTTSGQKGASTTRPAMPTISSDENSPITSEAEDDVAPLSAPGSVPPSAVPEIKGVAKGDLTFASSLRLADVNATDPVEAALGAWRFSDPAAEPMEDNLFVFQDESVPVAKRRKHFSKAEALRNFTYDPDVVYGTSFFSPFMDFNKFNLSIGPVNMNVSSYFSDMPVRYTLRSTRLVIGTKEEEVFATISFQLVDHP